MKLRTVGRSVGRIVVLLAAAAVLLFLISVATIGYQRTVGFVSRIDAVEQANRWALRMRWFRVPGLRLNDERVRLLYENALDAFLASHADLPLSVRPTIVIGSDWAIFQVQQLGSRYDLLPGRQLEARAARDGDLHYLWIAPVDGTFTTLRVRVLHQVEFAPGSVIIVEQRTSESYDCAPHRRSWSCTPVADT